MDADNTSPVGRFPSGFLTAAVMLTGLALVWFSWSTYRSWQVATAATKQNSRIEELRDTIVQLDEVLTMSARMAAATGDEEWEKRYRENEPVLDKAIKEASNVVPEAYRGDTAARTDEANRKLVAMENRAFELVRQNRAEEARSVLLSDEYKEQKAVYAEGMDLLADALAASSQENLNAEERRAHLAIGLS